jgi:hypothetical protein
VGISVRRLVVVASILLLLSLVLIPLSYTPTRVSIDVRRDIDISSSRVDTLEGFLGIDRGVKQTTYLRLYANLTCGKAINITIYYGGFSRSFLIDPGRIYEIPANDTNALLSIDGSPGCVISLSGRLEYQSYRLLWLSAVSFILGLSGGILLLRIISIDLSKRISRAS